MQMGLNGKRGRFLRSKLSRGDSYVAAANAAGVDLSTSGLDTNLTESHGVKFVLPANHEQEVIQRQKSRQNNNPNQNGIHSELHQQQQQLHLQNSKNKPQQNQQQGGPPRSQQQHHQQQQQQHNQHHQQQQQQHNQQQQQQQNGMQRRNPASTSFTDMRHVDRSPDNLLSRGYVPTRPKLSVRTSHISPAPISPMSTEEAYLRGEQQPLVSVLLSSPYSEVGPRTNSTSSAGRSDSFGVLSRATSQSSSRSERSNARAGVTGKSLSVVRSVSWRFRSAKRGTDGHVIRENDEWRSILSRIEYKVLREKYMEPPFSGKYIHFPPHLKTSDGVFLCRGCGERIFGPHGVKPTTTGWLTFSEVFPAVRFEQNMRCGMILSEVFCRSCGGFLGICDQNNDVLINSAVVEFVIPNLPATSINPIPNAELTSPEPKC
uniref:peptide-methionine (R)-S-oxide reductase n=1 Tax=Timspurckia oligopyrenoides TaxID=708627 RepID=A0A6T6PA28_9RHOD|mmetsp:Transcript_9675/g.17428  ORF Transcript_9675/g.17428 Transcript_9675/m.17428 type:complete len:431 (+) Transcript_9675:259-1551(+)|eukprot:CAMPEP_0182443704 /NCGR_PEP_ID=MMETSP1172-20130603/2365_1 /TAXON_ID=708627 /ORGANISM="Timspurckia oligopyrenoides, Strain CCMP3278" /LENGTH=430 /DNA_ID=CAMNT_0024639061 /DNA_START=216 /DNA_END=1508 /DNA_ORIENTATION=-